jgi:beta-glucosidase
MGTLRFLGLAARSAFSGRPRLEFSPEEIRSAELGCGLPKDFLLGCATAAHQIEGGNENDWSDWERGSYPDGRPHIARGDVSGAASDSWNRFDEDLRLLKELGANAYRFGIEWARLEPEEGAWNAEAAQRYRSWLEKLRAAGIRSMVTLHHFTLPKWVAKDGGFASDKTIDRFAAFVSRAIDALGEPPDLWCTLNEPNVLAIESYVKGVWPPGLQDVKVAAQVLARILRAHARVAPMLRDKTHRPVGIAHHVRVFRPASRSPVDGIVAGVTDDFVNQAIIDAAMTGRIRIHVPGSVTIDEQVPDLKGSFDYLGLNYYTRDHVAADFKDPALSRQFVPENRPTNDLGWELYPEGLYLLLKRFGKLGLPIHVTENGMPDNAGTRRGDYLRAHFYALQRAVKEGADVRGYFHWSLIDNFEWAEGFEPRFGLYRVDYQSPDKRRTPTSGVPVFQEIARHLGLSPAVSDVPPATAAP